MKILLYSNLGSGLSHIISILLVIFFWLKDQRGTARQFQYTISFNLGDEKAHVPKFSIQSISKLESYHTNYVIDCTSETINNPQPNTILNQLTHNTCSYKLLFIVCVIFAGFLMRRLTKLKLMVDFIIL